ncbi:hypothetical protein [Paramesorhizobium deserti]|uniref:hypothetical protein n=1 Tax=Paramesorhizobium deserti TaxID=1494590 RepID=UPI00137B802E|nr:hypothetical protein [Paramesorhizobium deserti]
MRENPNSVTGSPEMISSRKGGAKSLVIELVFLFVLFAIAAAFAVLPTVFSLWRHLPG